MAYELLFGNNIKPACIHCINGNKSSRYGEYMCKYRGIVLADFKCRRFQYDPISRVPKRQIPFEKFDDDAFNID